MSQGVHTHLVLEQPRPTSFTHQKSERHFRTCLHYQPQQQGSPQIAAHAQAVNTRPFLFPLTQPGNDPYSGSCTSSTTLHVVQVYVKTHDYHRAQWSLNLLDVNSPLPGSSWGREWYCCWWQRRWRGSGTPQEQRHLRSHDSVSPPPWTQMTI